MDASSACVGLGTECVPTVHLAVYTEYGCLSDPLLCVAGQVPPGCTTFVVYEEVAGHTSTLWPQRVASVSAKECVPVDGGKAVVVPIYRAAGTWFQTVRTRSKSFRAMWEGPSETTNLVVAIHMIVTPYSVDIRACRPASDIPIRAKALCKRVEYALNLLRTDMPLEDEGAIGTPDVYLYRAWIAANKLSKLTGVSLQDIVGAIREPVWGYTLPTLCALVPSPCTLEIQTKLCEMELIAPYSTSHILWHPRKPLLHMAFQVLSGLLHDFEDTIEASAVAAAKPASDASSSERGSADCTS